MATYWLHIQSELEMREFADAVSHVLGIGELAEHESENYPGGIYFRGHLNTVTLEITYEDTPGYDQFQYWIILDSDTVLHQEQINKIVLQLISAGFGVALGLDESESLIIRRIFSLSGTILSSYDERIVLD